MDLGFIDMCLKSYDGKLSAEDDARVQFFRGLWGTMDQEIRARDMAAYEVPALDELRTAYAEGTPILAVAPVTIDVQQFAETAQALSTYLVESGTYDDTLNEALVTLDWAGAFENMGGLLAPDRVQEALTQFVVAIDDAFVAQLARSVATLTLFTFLEAPAHAIMDAIGHDEVIDTHPLFCPVCGGEPTIASVGAPTSSAGRGRMLYCATCGAGWEFDRVRCAHCGTHDQTKLHYVSIEGDEDHRVAFCDECKGFMRTTFLENNLFPVSPLVEDVVMAPLAAVGAQLVIQRKEADDHR